MVQIATTIKNYFVDSGSLCFFGDKLANFLCLLTFPIEFFTLEILIIGREGN